MWYLEYGLYIVFLSAIGKYICGYSKDLEVLIVCDFGKIRLWYRSNFYQNR
jgi:hypothetical protein